jgi:hypothetical protein
MQTHGAVPCEVLPDTKGKVGSLHALPSKEQKEHAPLKEKKGT